MCRVHTRFRSRAGIQVDHVRGRLRLSELSRHSAGLAAAELTPSRSFAVMSDGADADHARRVMAELILTPVRAPSPATAPAAR